MEKLILNHRENVEVKVTLAQGTEINEYSEAFANVQQNIFHKEKQSCWKLERTTQR